MNQGINIHASRRKELTIADNQACPESKSRYKANPKGPCTQIVYTLALNYLHRDYIKAKVYTIWVHGPLG